jgi:hypothetical protein
MTNRKRTNNRLQYITQKTKDRAARTPLKTRDEFNKIAFINTFTLSPVINTHKLSTIIQY